MTDDIDLKAVLKIYFPSMFEVLEDEQISWANITKTFKKEFKEREARMEPGHETLTVKANFYDVIVAAINGQEQPIRLLDYYDKLFQEVAMRLDGEQKKKLKTTVFNLLVSTGWNYLHYLGELATLNQLLKSGNYHFTQAEIDLGNGKGGDFHLIEIKTGHQLIIEVLNIVLDKELPADDAGLKTFLTKRFADKIKDKSKNGTATLPFVLAPVIWGPFKDLKRLSDFYKKNKIELPNCLEAAAYSTFLQGDGSFYHMFGKINTLFDDLPADFNAS